MVMDCNFEHLDSAAQKVMHYFLELSKIPRGSWNKKPISDFCYNCLKSMGLEVEQDEHYNIIARKEATPGYENSPVTMLQSHMDMVCEKNEDVIHDFDKDPINVIVDGDVVKADGTTLGADDGLGIASIFAILSDKNISHPPLEVVLTTDEETDFTGAYTLDYSKLKSKYILNLDAAPVSIAGGGDREVVMSIGKRYEPIKNENSFYTIKVEGLKGGHSGENAMAERGNAIMLLNRTLCAIVKELPIQVLHLHGGETYAAIARSSHAEIAFAPANEQKVSEIVAKCQDVFSNELKISDPNVKVSLAPCSEKFTFAYSMEIANKIMTLLTIIPDGVSTQNKEYKGYMESTSSVGVLHDEGDKIILTSDIRSFIRSRKDYLEEKVNKVCDLLDVEYKVDYDAPPWDFCVDDKLMNLIKEIYGDNRIRVQEGTVEPSVFCNSIPGLLGVVTACPPYYNPHSPGEYFLLSELERDFHNLCTLIAKLK